MALSLPFDHGLAMGDTNLSYWTAREAAERAAAESSANPRAAAAHRRMAALYAGRLRAAVEAAAIAESPLL